MGRNISKKLFFPLIFVQTSTPASSFMIKSNTPDSVPKTSKFQRTNMIRTASSDSVEASDEEHKLPYRYVECSPTC